jgi:hypothetical protein
LFRIAHIEERHEDQELPAYRKAKREKTMRTAYAKPVARRRNANTTG